MRTTRTIRSFDVFGVATIRFGIRNSELGLGVRVRARVRASLVWQQFGSARAVPERNDGGAKRGSVLARGRWGGEEGKEESTVHLSRGPKRQCMKKSRLGKTHARNRSVRDP